MKQNDVMAAIDFLRKQNVDITEDIKDDDNHYFEILEYLEGSLKANNLAISALEKQIPQSIDVLEGLNEIRCPKCTTILGMADEETECFNNCHHCGQKLDWKLCKQYWKECELK